MAPHLEMDQFRARILPLSNQGVDDRDVAYEAMHFAAESFAGWCETAILDATYTATPCRAGLVDVVERTGGALFVIECYVSAAAAAERFSSRDSHPAVDLTESRVRTLAEDYPYFAPACRIRTDSDTPEYGRILEVLAGPALDREARDAWTRAGRPREKSAVTL